MPNKCILRLGQVVTLDDWEQGVRGQGGGFISVGIRDLRLKQEHSEHLQAHMSLSKSTNLVGERPDDH